MRPAVHFLILGLHLGPYYCVPTQETPYRWQSAIEIAVEGP